MTAAKILLTTFGSLGDLHPYIAVGKGLHARGHEVTLATSALYRAKVEGEGLAFRPVRPEMEGIIDPEVMRRAMHPVTGTKYVVSEMFLPFLEQAYEDTLGPVREADLIVSHPIAFATPLAAETAGKPWISVALAPSMMLSAFDPPHIHVLPFAEQLRAAGPGFWRALLGLARRAGLGSGAPIARMRARLGLPAHTNPIFDSLFSPWGTQAWFSRVMADPQRDWPAKTLVTGFPFYDRLEPGSGMSQGLRRFLDAGPPPVVFTLGSSAVFDAGAFYTESIEAARLAGRRAVLLTGFDPRNLPRHPLPASVFVADYAPYSELFAHAAAIVHQGGVGTTAQAMRSGRPMIVVPFSHDQPDNAHRMARLGIARVVPRARYRADRVAAELAGIHRLATKAAQVGEAVRSEDGVASACEGIEAYLAR